MTLCRPAKLDSTGIATFFSTALFIKKLLKKNRELFLNLAEKCAVPFYSLSERGLGLIQGYCILEDENKIHQHCMLELRIYNKRVRRGAAIV